MKNRVLVLLAAVAMFSGLFGNVPTALASASTIPDTLAGRPIMGDANRWCQGTVYGRVNSYLVLFTAGHCADNQSEGAYVYDEWNRAIGTWSTCCGGYAQADDLAYIRLFPQFYPADPSLIYRGNGTYFRNTSHWADEADCNVLPGDVVGTQIDEAFQPYWDTTQWFRYTSSSNYMASNDGWRCTVHTGLNTQWPEGCIVDCEKDSGAPFILNAFPTQVVGVGHGKDGAGKLDYQSLHSGIRDYDIYWRSHGGNLGAWFCTSVSCA